MDVGLEPTGLLVQWTECFVELFYHFVCFWFLTFWLSWHDFQLEHTTLNHCLPSQPRHALCLHTYFDFSWHTLYSTILGSFFITFLNQWRFLSWFLSGFLHHLIRQLKILIQGCFRCLSALGRLWLLNLGRKILVTGLVIIVIIDKQVRQLAAIRFAFQLA